jgi:hypothetical protein
MSGIIVSTKAKCRERKGKNMKIENHEIRTKDELIYIVVDDRGTDVYESAFTTFEEVQQEADKTWSRLSWRDRKDYLDKKYRIYVCAIEWNKDYLVETDGEDASFTYRHSSKLVEGGFDTEVIADVLNELDNIARNLDASNMFYSENQDYDLWDKINPDTCYIWQLLKDANLPELELDDIINVPTDYDYYHIIDEEEKEMWEEKADKINRENEAKGIRCVLSGYDAWLEETGAYDECDEFLSSVSDKINDYINDVKGW